MVIRDIEGIYEDVIKERKSECLFQNPMLQYVGLEVLADKLHDAAGKGIRPLIEPMPCPVTFMGTVDGLLEPLEERMADMIGSLLLLVTGDDYGEIVHCDWHSS